MASDWIPAKVRVVERRRIAGQIFDDLHERILSGELDRGARLPNERELAKAYGVSGATVREALRALATMHMIEVRHGSGAYITANAEQLIAQSLQSMIRLERIDIHDILGILATLHAHCAELAAARATPEEIDELRSALDQAEQAASAEDLGSGLQRFLFGFAAASHNALLAAICNFLTRLQIGMAQQIAAGSVDAWRRISGRLTKDRRNLVEALAKGDVAAARSLAVTYAQHAVQVIDTVALRGKDKVLHRFLNAPVSGSRVKQRGDSRARAKSRSTTSR